jgi:hypothetical protein
VPVHIGPVISLKETQVQKQQLRVVGTHVCQITCSWAPRSVKVSAIEWNSNSANASPLVFLYSFAASAGCQIVCSHLSIPARKASKLQDRVRTCIHSLCPEGIRKPLRKSAPQVSTAQYVSVSRKTLTGKSARALHPYAYTGPSNLTNFGHSRLY